MSRQRSGTSSTSGRGSQSGGSTRATSSSRTTAQDQELGGAQSSGGGAQTGGSFAAPDAQGGVGGEQSVKEKAQQVAGQVQQKATQRVESGLARGKTRAAETLSTVADSLITTGQQLRERQQEPVSRYVDQVADRVQRVSNYLQSTDISEIVDRTEQFARRRPALFLGGAFALGLLGARFLKSSNRGPTAQGQWAGGGSAGSGQRKMREGITGIELEVPASPQQEWAASHTPTAGLADVASPGAGGQTDLLGGPSLGRERGPLDFGSAPGGPEAAQR